MGIFELLIIAVGLSMDAFAVSVCTGLGIGKLKAKDMITVGLYFGIFQGVMPLIGYFLGAGFADKITAYDHWIAFALLSFIGGKMVYESLSEKFGKEKSEAKETEEIKLTPKKMLPLAIATSIDALAVGVTFAFLKVNIITASSFIAVITFILSVIGVKLGNIFGLKFKWAAELAGGVILILMGVKILAEHLL